MINSENMGLVQCSRASATGAIGGVGRAIYNQGRVSWRQPCRQVFRKILMLLPQPQFLEGVQWSKLTTAREPTSQAHKQHTLQPLWREQGREWMRGVIGGGIQHLLKTELGMRVPTSVCPDSLPLLPSPLVCL